MGIPRVITTLLIICFPICSADIPTITSINGKTPDPCATSSTKCISSSAEADAILVATGVEGQSLIVNGSGFPADIAIGIGTTYLCTGIQPLLPLMESADGTSLAVQLTTTQVTIAQELGATPRQLCWSSPSWNGGTWQATGVTVKVVWLCNDTLPCADLPITGAGYDDLTSAEKHMRRSRTECCMSQLTPDIGQCIDPNLFTCCGGLSIRIGSEQCDDEDNAVATWSSSSLYMLRLAPLLGGGSTSFVHRSTAPLILHIEQLLSHAAEVDRFLASSLGAPNLLTSCVQLLPISTNAVRATVYCRSALSVGEADGICRQLQDDIAERMAVPDVSLGPQFLTINGITPASCLPGQPNCSPTVAASRTVLVRASSSSALPSSYLSVKSTEASITVQGAYFPPCMALGVGTVTSCASIIPLPSTGDACGTSLALRTYALNPSVVATEDPVPRKLCYAIDSNATYVDTGFLVQSVWVCTDDVSCVTRPNLTLGMTKCCKSVIQPGMAQCINPVTQTCCGGAVLSSDTQICCDAATATATVNTAQCPCSNTTVCPVGQYCQVAYPNTDDSTGQCVALGLDLTDMQGDTFSNEMRLHLTTNLSDFNAPLFRTAVALATGSIGVQNVRINSASAGSTNVVFQFVSVFADVAPDLITNLSIAVDDPNNTIHTLLSIEGPLEVFPAGSPTQWTQKVWVWLLLFVVFMIGLVVLVSIFAFWFLYGTPYDPRKKARNPPIPEPVTLLTVPIDPNTADPVRVDLVTLPPPPPTVKPPRPARVIPVLPRWFQEQVKREKEILQQRKLHKHRGKARLMKEAAASPAARRRSQTGSVSGSVAPGSVTGDEREDDLSSSETDPFYSEHDSESDKLSDRYNDEEDEDEEEDTSTISSEATFPRKEEEEEKFEEIPHAVSVVVDNIGSVAPSTPRVDLP